MYLKYHIGTGGNWTTQRVHAPRYAQKSHVRIPTGGEESSDAVGFHTQRVRDYINDLIGTHNGYELSVVTRAVGVTPWDEANDILDNIHESWEPIYTGVFWPVKMPGVEWHGRYDGILTNCPAYLLNDEGETIEVIRG